MAYEKSKDELREEVTRQVNKKKNTNRWCKGKVGVPHEDEIVLNHNLSHRVRCGWRDSLRRWRTATPFRAGEWVQDPEDRRYYCRHSKRCTKCGKYTEYMLDNVEECPEYVAKPAT